MFVKNMKYYLLVVLMFTFFGVSEAGAFPWNFDMWIQPSIVPYEEPVIYPKLSVSTTGFRIEPLPREDFELITRNPVPATPESVENGQEAYNTYCIVCHGPEGKGDGPVIKRGFYPLNLASPGVIGRTDGYIYAYIRYGGKVMMPSYRESITAEEAWDVVNYVRKLQGNPDPKPEPDQAEEKDTAEESVQEDGSTN
ncbi:MAG: cytochrome c [Deltaproteobacteria bacterium]